MAFPLYAPSVFLPRRRHEYICFITVIKINALRKKIEKYCESIPCFHVPTLICKEKHHHIPTLFPSQ